MLHVSNLGTRSFCTVSASTTDAVASLSRSLSPLLPLRVTKSNKRCLLACSRTETTEANRCIVADESALFFPPSPIQCRLGRRPLVRTARRLYVPTRLASPLTVPLTVADVHLRSEQLPFAYFFEESLDFDLLEQSLAEVLRRYPVVGGRVEYGGGGVPRIVCEVDDGVDMSFGFCDELSMEQWLHGGKQTDDGGDGRTEKGGRGPSAPCRPLLSTLAHSSTMQHLHRAGHRPVLLPLFDDLFSPPVRSGSDHHNDDDDDDDDASHSGGTRRGRQLASVRVTRFACGGTALGVNLSHMLADADSCVRFAGSWGREMRGLAHPPGASNDRSSATVSGMACPMVVDLLDLLGQEDRLCGPMDRVVGKSDDDGRWGVGVDAAADLTRYLRNVLPAWGGDGDGDADPASIKWGVHTDGKDDSNDDNDSDSDNDNDNDNQENKLHEYIHLPFSPDVLMAMKQYGMDHCNQQQHRSRRQPPSDPYPQSDYVSTNDMITAFGWLLKRHLSGMEDWNVSVVVNLRGRGGVDNFSDRRCGVGTSGVFGNALTNVTAKLPPPPSSSSLSSSFTFPLSSYCATGEAISGCKDADASEGEGKGKCEGGEGFALRPVDVAIAASAVRMALIEGTADISDRVARSRMGRAFVQSSSDAATSHQPSFAATSWQRFPLWDVRFSASTAPSKTVPAAADDGNDSTANVAVANLVGFHGHPSHPLPANTGTYSSVSSTNRDGGITYELLAPSTKAEEAKRVHGRLCEEFLAWAAAGEGEVFS